MSTPETESGITRSPYDNSISILYKEAARLGVPVRFVLIRPSEETETEFIENFNLEDYPNSTFITIFDLVRSIYTQDDSTTLIRLWEIISNFRGDSFNPLEIVPIWLYAIPEYQVESPVLLELVNNYYSYLGEPEKFNSMAEVVANYRNNWLPKYEAEKTKDQQRLDKFIRVQNEIAGIAPLVHSPLEIDTVTIIYESTTEPGINPLPDLFDTAVTSYIAPFIQYNITPISGQPEDIERYYKIYKGKSVDTRPNYNNTTLKPEHTKDKQALYVKLWSGPELESKEEVEMDAKTGKKEGFRTVTVAYLEPNGPNAPGILRVTMNIPIRNPGDKITMINRLHSHLPGLEIPDMEVVRETWMTGSFIIYNTNMVEIIISHLIMNDPLFSTYLYLEEARTAAAERTQYKVRYRGTSNDITESKGKADISTRAAVTSNLSKDKIEAGRFISIVKPDGTTKKVSFETPTPVVRVKITSASSKRLAYQYMEIMAKLFRRYLEQGRQILDYYLQYIPQYNTLLQQVKPETGQVSSSGIVATNYTEIPGESRNERILRLAPDVFKTGYARVCQKELQPLIIGPEDVERWRNNLVVRPDGSTEMREVMRFPKEGPQQYYFTCPTNDRPYVYLKAVQQTKNAKEFPCLPCCGITPNLTKKECLHGLTAETKKKKNGANYVYKSGKIAEPGRRATISSILSSFFTKYDENSGEFYRLGVPNTPNSFIHCIAVAMNDPSYNSAPDKEEYVKLLRDKLFTLGILPELLKQELYDLSGEDIKELVADQEKFFNPSFFYRALEELYNCTIYVFGQNAVNEETGLPTSLLREPRHRYFHVRPPVPNRPVVVILRHIGAERDALAMPQCELLVEHREKVQIRTFGNSMNDLIYSASTFVERTITWQISNTIYEDRYVPTLTARLNIYSSLNYPMIFGKVPIVAQLIDHAGKVRMFALAPEYANEEHTSFSNLRIFVAIPPTAPVNVPEFMAEAVTDLLPPYQKIMEMFSEPVSITTTTDGNQLTGIWFSFGDVKLGFYCPCQLVNVEEFHREYPNVDRQSESSALTIHIPRHEEKRSNIDRAKVLLRAAKFIDQIVKYLYLIAGKPKDTTNFLYSISAMIPERDKGDSADYYNISNIKRILPEGIDVTEVLRQLEAESPRLFRSAKIPIYDEQMYRGLLYQLNRYAKRIEGLDIRPQQLRELQGFYSTKEYINFDSRHEFLLSSLREYNYWTLKYVISSSTKQREIQNLKENIQTRLTPEAYTYSEPYIYQRITNSLVTSYDPRSDKFYLIQSVLGSDFRRAIQVAYTWYLDKRNSGFATEPWPNEAAIRAGFEPEADLFPQHVIYRISPGGGVIVKQNNAEGASLFLEILDYGNNLYAAMLPIL